MTIAPRLQEDTDEMDAKGYSRGIRSGELAALVEAFFSGIYSSVDCARQVVAEIYRGLNGVTSKSTRRFFQNAADGALDARLPVRIREAFAEARWYRELRRIRDAIIHSDVGSCHFSNQTKKFFYMHSGLDSNNHAMIIDDIFARMKEIVDAVNLFLGKIFEELNSSLKNDEVWQICGIFGGRIYTRYVRPFEARDFHSGRCDAYKWFELSENPTCPFADICEAYKHAKKRT